MKHSDFYVVQCVILPYNPTLLLTVPVESLENHLLRIWDNIEAFGEILFYLRTFLRIQENSRVTICQRLLQMAAVAVLSK